MAALSGAVGDTLAAVLAHVSMVSVRLPQRRQTMFTFIPYAAAGEYPALVGLLQFVLASRARCGADATSLERLRYALRTAALWLSAAPLSVNAWVAATAFADARRSLEKAHIPAENRPLSPKQRAAELLSLLIPIPQLLGPAVRVVRSVRFGKVFGAELKLDAFLPRDARPGDKRPVFFYVHGGGWITGHRSAASLPLLFGLADRGAVCFTINYRLAPKYRYPAGLHDSKRALAWVRRHAARFGGNPECVVVGGESAGGHIALMVTLSAGAACAISFSARALARARARVRAHTRLTASPHPLPFP